MTLFDAFRYDGKRALVVGGATGMGAAAAELLQSAGAEVVVMDFAEMLTAGGHGHPGEPRRTRVDRRRRRPVRRADRRALLLCRRGRRHAGHREDQLHRPPAPDRPPARQGPCSPAARPSGSSRRRPDSAGNPTSPGSRSIWPPPTSTARWIEWHAPTAVPTTCSTKQAICAYVASQAFPMVKRGIRINAICPGPTDTPLAQANKETVARRSAPTTGARLGVETSTPLEQAYPLVFLCSEAAAAISGITIVTRTSAT